MNKKFYRDLISRLNWDHLYLELERQGWVKDYYVYYDSGPNIDIFTKYNKDIGSSLSVHKNNNYVDYEIRLIEVLNEICISVDVVNYLVAK